MFRENNSLISMAILKSKTFLYTSQECGAANSTEDAEEASWSINKHLIEMVSLKELRGDMNGQKLGG